MTTYRRFIPLTVLALTMAAGFPAMAETASVVTGTKHEYVYYGDHEIYFRPETKTYYWRENSQWQSGTQLPTASRSYVTTGGLTVELDTERPYEQHSAVVTRYKTAHPGGRTTTTERVVATNPDGSSTTTTTTTKQKYVYYGEHDIYFAPERKTYYWRNGERWESGTTLPPASRSFVTGNGMTIELDTEQPYTRQEYVVTKYRDWNEQN